jgi:hypothetical protein
MIKPLRKYLNTSCPRKCGLPFATVVAFRKVDTLQSHGPSSRHPNNNTNVGLPRTLRNVYEHDRTLQLASWAVVRQ